MSNLAEVWAEIKHLLDDNLSLIPVRDKDQILANGDVLVAKSPYKTWKEYQYRRAVEKELWESMAKYDTEAIGIVTGAVSGNLEVIDIDVKYYAGIDAIISKDLKEIYPHLFDKLRIHRTKNNGFHLIYRVSDAEVPGSTKLAGRYATDEEIEEAKARGVRKPPATVNFIETRGEGGYIVAPPSFGYYVHKQRPIPVITWEERCSLISLCQTYNTIITVAKAPAPTKAEDNMYDENPFESYNRQVDPTDLLEQFDWKYSHHNNKFIWYTRPGKTRGVSMSFNTEIRMFYNFTSSTELEAEKGYRPSSILLQFAFNGDGKACYQWLVNNGYGKLKSNVERQIIKQQVLKGGSGPANLSAAAKDQLAAEKAKYSESHPYGIFWAEDKDEKIKIDREGIYRVSDGLGFRIHNGDIYRIDGIFIDEQSKRKYFDTIKQYIIEEDAEIYNEICNAYEAFIQRSGDFTITRIPELETELILEDGPGHAFKFYQNLYIEITDGGGLLRQYPESGIYVYRKKVFKRDYQNSPIDQGKYYEFLEKAIGVSDYLKQIIGYLTHDYKDESTGYIVVLTEQVPDPKQGGGSGKNIFGNLLRNVITLTSVSGSQVQMNERFLQTWKQERVFFIADVPKKFDFSFLKEISTGYGTLKKLYKNEESISPDQMPKLLVNTNFSFDAADGGLKRRILPIEFSNFFTKAGGVDEHFKCFFPTILGKGSGWTDLDWFSFDSFIIDCLCAYFRCRGKIVATELTNTGWEKQFRQNYGAITYDFIKDNFEQWCTECIIPVDRFKNDYVAHCTAENVSKQFQLTSIKMNEALTEWCKKHNVEFEASIQARPIGTFDNTRCKKFGNNYF